MSVFIDVVESWGMIVGYRRRCWFFFLMIRRPPRSTQSRSSAASDVYKRQVMAVVPSKFHKDSNVEMKFGRKILSYGLMYTNRFLLKLPKNVDDVGCGLKLFRKELIERILPSLRVNNFAIDSEILNLIGRVGYSVSVIPFYLNKNRSDSTSANIGKILGMVKDIFVLSLSNRYIFKNSFSKPSYIDNSGNL